MRLYESCRSRVVVGGSDGMDLTDTLGKPTMATPEGIRCYRVDP